MVFQLHLKSMTLSSPPLKTQKLYSSITHLLTESHDEATVSPTQTEPITQALSTDPMVFLI